MFTRKHAIILLSLIVVAAAFRIAVVRAWPNDDQDDGRVYSQIARDVIEHHVYSLETEPPYDPTFVRVPGYPLLLAAIYVVFGHGNDSAVRIVEALIDTGTCLLVALIAYYWQPNEKQKFNTAIAALGFAAVNPFTSIYAAAILTEVPMIFFSLAACLAATLALLADNPKSSLRWSVGGGVLGGLATMFRPDTGLLVAMIVLILFATTVVRAKAITRHTVGLVAVFSLGFVLVLAPWTIRNWRVFHSFQPLAPSNATMPDAFSPYGYERWMKTWVADRNYNESFWWGLNDRQLDIDDLPDDAFDSQAEHDRVETLLEGYNHPSTDSDNADSGPSSPQDIPTPSPLPSPPGNATMSATPAPKSASTNTGNANSEDSEEDDDQDQDSDQESEKNKSATNARGEMTPAIDAAFGQIANERIARHPIRYYFLLPLKRMHAIWFNTHSDLYPFDGDLLPLSDLDHTTHQHIWLPIFALLVAIYTIAGVAGLIFLLDVANVFARGWAVLVILIIVSRLVLLSTVVSVEPRYVVIFFPFLAVLTAIAMVKARELLRRHPPAAVQE